MGLQLVDVTPCIDFNGTDFVAQDCDTITAPVTFVNGELVAGTACSTGVNSFSDITISATGEGCATFTATTVPRVIDNAGTLASTDVVSVATTADAVATDVASTSTSGAVTRTSDGHRLGFVSPEMALSTPFHENVFRVNCVELVIDESHSASEWGEDFRPTFSELIRRACSQHQRGVAFFDRTT